MGSGALEKDLNIEKGRWKRMKDIEKTVEIHDISIEDLYSEIESLRRRLELLETKIQQLEWRLNYQLSKR
jgi:phage shock protein A